MSDLETMDGDALEARTRDMTLPAEERWLAALEEIRRARELVQSSKEVALAHDVLWFHDENKRMRATFNRFVKDLKANKALHFEASGCGWCGEVWLKPDGSTADDTKLRARRHDFVCAKHPMRAEINALRAELGALRTATNEETR